MPRARNNIVTPVYILIVLVLSFSVFAQYNMLLESARAAGMGGAYVALGDDANSVSSNPSGLMRVDRTQFIGGYTQYFTGSNIESLQEGSMFFSPFTWSKFFYGLGLSYFNHEIYRQQALTLVVGREIWRHKKKARISAAVNANLYRIDYNSASFSEDFDPDDPVFANGYSRFSYGADFSFLAEYGPLSLGLKAYNLNEPEISLRAGAEGGRLKRRLRTGLSYDIMGYITPVAEVELPLTSDPGVSDEMSYVVGAESWFVKKMIGARAGYNPDYLSAGLSFRTRSSWDIGFDYAVQIPFDMPVAVGQNHKFSLYMGMKKPKRVITDFIVEEGSVHSIPELTPPGDTAVVYATVTNIGDMDARNVPVSMYYFDDGKPVLLDQAEIDRIESGESRDVMMSFVPTRTMYYDLFVAANDKGGKLPSVDRKILEWDYDNNTAQGQTATFEAPSGGEVRSSRNELVISTVSRTLEEAPMIPYVFFKEGSHEMDRTRFEIMQSVIARRQEQNPAIILEVRGYYDSSTEGTEGKDLALARAREVKNNLVSMGADSKRVKVIEDGYDMGAQKVKAKFQKDRRLVQEENRGVEISVKIIGQSTDLYEYIFEDGEIKPGREGREDWKELLESLYPFLTDNPDINIIFFGYSVDGEENPIEKAYARAKSFYDMTTEWAPPWVLSRLLVMYKEETRDKPMVEIKLNGDAIIYRPRGSTAISGMEFSELGVTEISIDSITSEAGIDTYAVVVREEGSEKPFTVLETGKGMPPRSLEWNWFGSVGQAPDPTKEYNVEVYVQDKFGQSFTAISDPVSIKVRDQEERRELFIINFNFGKAEATSDYLEARVEALAEKLINRAKYLGPNARIKATVVGHTDIVGSEEANEQLSLERARKEYDRLVSGMMSILGIDGEDRFEEWLDKNRVELSYQGVSYTEPMEIHYWEHGYWHTELIGRNDLPEGRLVNRRVILEVITYTE